MNLQQSLILAFLLLLSTFKIFAQDETHSSQSRKWESSSYTYGEFKIGYSVNQFSTGLSERFEEGNFSTSGGGLTSIAVYRKFTNLNYLNLGLKFKGLGGSPSTGDDDEEMFFNFWGVALSLKYFPINKNASEGIYIIGDFNFVTQFTQKYRKTSDLIFDHQFAIGNSLTFGLGY